MMAMANILTSTAHDCIRQRLADVGNCSANGADRDAAGGDQPAEDAGHQREPPVTDSPGVVVEPTLPVSQALHRRDGVIAWEVSASFS